MTLQPPPPPPAFAPDLACIVQLRPADLAALLQLPAGAVIDYVQQRIDEPGTLQMRIRGAGVPVAPGAVIAPVRPIITRHVTLGEDGSELVTYNIDWRWPNRARDEEEIRELGRLHGALDLVEVAIAAGSSVEQFRGVLLQRLATYRQWPVADAERAADAR